MQNNSKKLSFKKLQNAVDKALLFIQSKQQTDGSFISMTSVNSDFQNAVPMHTTFFTSLILSSLSNNTQPIAVALNQKAAAFLLSQKNQHWSWNYWIRESKEAKTYPYPDDLDDTFCALSALYQFDKTIIDGTVMAKVVAMLTALEEKEGGPYYTWLVDATAPKVWKDVDVAVNSNIAYFLSLHGITLPNSTACIEKQIQKDGLLSPYYVSEFPILYFISRWYTGNKRKLLQQILLNKKDKNGIWENPLYTALCVSSLIRLGYPAKKLSKSISYLIMSQKNDEWGMYPFVKERVQKDQIAYGGSAALTAAFCIEALALYINARKRTVPEKNRDVKEYIYMQVMEQVANRYEQLDPQLKKKAQQLIKILIEKDRLKQIPLLPYYFASHLQNKKNIPDSLLIILGAANVYGWIAYTIFDDVIDGDTQDMQAIILGTVSLRELTTIFLSIQQTDFHQQFHVIMDRLDSATAWEIKHCRVTDLQTPIQKIVLPDFGDYTIIAKKSLGHVLGPVAILSTVGIASDAKEMHQLVAFFTHFLVAKQLNDDAHDWEKDLRRGQINPAGALVLSQFKTKNKKLSKSTINAAMPKLQEHFWMHTIDDICGMIFDHIGGARKSLQRMEYLTDSNFFELFLSPLEKAAQKARDEKKKMLEFLDTYERK